jgi:hypothetical protein
VIGDSIVAAGTIAYLGAFTSEFRHQLVEEWLHALLTSRVPHTEHTNVCSTLANPVEVRRRVFDARGCRAAFVSSLVPPPSSLVSLPSSVV